MNSNNGIYFSIVVCTYNRSSSLSRTLESLISQIFPKKEFEIIIVDNRSTDNTQKVCDNFTKSNPENNIITLVENSQGISFALNRGIKEAKGKFIVYVDDDETVDENHLKNLQGFLKQYPYTQLAASSVIPIYEGGEPKWMSRFTQRLIGGTFEEKTKVVKVLRNTYPGTGHTIILKSLYDKYGLYNTDLGRKANGLLGAEDKDMAFRLKENGVVCYFFPNIPIYHHIPERKLTSEYFKKLTYSLGVSERIRTKNISEKAYCKRIFAEGVKWCASLVLFFYYFLTLSPSKGYKLLQFRANVTRGLFSNSIPE